MLLTAVSLPTPETRLAAHQNEQSSGAHLRDGRQRAVKRVVRKLTGG
jgi:hypothetical protein